MARSEIISKPRIDKLTEQLAVNHMQFFKIFLNELKEKKEEFWVYAYNLSTEEVYRLLKFGCTRTIRMSVGCCMRF